MGKVKSKLKKKQDEESINETSSLSEEHDSGLPEATGNQGKNSLVNNNTIMVAAIDLGTTYSGYAFAFRNKPESIYMNPNWTQGNYNSYKTASCVLIGPNDEFVTFGFEATNSILLQDKPGDYHLFNNFKMKLHRDKDLTTDKRIASTSGHIFKAQKIFSYMIKGLKDHCLNHISKSQITAPSVDMIQWVLTVPAIWSDTAKDFMRQAACEAGLIKTKDSNLLTIALEPEAAGIVCKTYPVSFIHRDQKEENQHLTLRKNDKYLVIDAGGGTVDITSYTVSDNGEIYELIPPNGGPWGGIHIDNKFKEKLSELLGKDLVKDYEHSHPHLFLDLMGNFELQKKTPGIKEIRINVGYQLGKMYFEYHGTKIDDDINKKKVKGVSFSNGCLMFNTCDIFFKETIAKITDHVKTLLKESSLDGVNYVMLVGGFGQCEILQEALRKIIPPKCFLIIPEETQIAVVKGAVLFGIKPDTVKCRIASKTYGAGIMKIFNSAEHSREHMVTICGKEWCDGVFEPFILKGQSVRYGDVITKHRSPVQEYQSEMVVDIYCTDKTDFKKDDYVDKPCMQKLGHVIVEMPNVEMGFDRAVLVDFQFGGTEIKVTARDQSSGKKTETQIAFCL